MVSINKISLNNISAAAQNNVSFKGKHSASTALYKALPNCVREAFYTDPATYLIGSNAECDSVDMKKNADLYLKISDIAKKKSEITYDKAKSAINKAQAILLDLRMSDTKNIWGEDGTHSILNKPYIRCFNEKTGTNMLVTLSDDSKEIKKIDISHDDNYEHRIININPKWNPDGISVSKGVRFLTDGTVTKREEMDFDKDGKLTRAAKGIVIKKDKNNPNKITAHNDANFIYDSMGRVILAEKDSTENSDHSSYTGIRYVYDSDGSLSLVRRGLKIGSGTATSKGIYKFKKNEDGENILIEYTKNNVQGHGMKESWSRKIEFDENGAGVICEK